MRFYETMLKVAARMTFEGHIVLMPYVNRNALSRDTAPGTVDMLTMMHREKIRLSSRLFVVNCSLDNTGNALGPTYVGNDTMMEIAYAKLMCIPVDYLHRHIESGLGMLFV